ncbi:bifunctional cobalt-precorrin-7 (C(5))-methyltransferase/cobalt-precorrin-6B (C(15))-methyltransferase [Acetobacter cerevisiae]|uniref:Precorrin-6Y C5,15-methyltransferase n=1 Tax=Acetobacter cerevisiae TaxID=178900 RepID=A0A149Q412_9PROT|nr:bifunctional cobalt-precorrin-7 (C(5))-methyltransferase/cobalt-precorrin-6B (C(15))-methyltransferase [Acetobacter cerevisiae]KXU92012.1 precorrin-6Y C5,15-methyltransferase [Acetobacter cerevisiae]GBQ08030.1 cobalamin biosynthesis protein precorrin-6Y C5,15-methyltransferase [Acetobacter cerevisiae DSM 14362]
MSDVWLTLIGIGEDGLDGLSPAARTLLSHASYVVGGARHLELAAKGIHGETAVWPSPFQKGVDAILARRGTPVVVLASGDPFFYGVGATLAKHVQSEEMLCLPAPSSISLACARLGWALQDCRVVSLCGRNMHRMKPFLQPGARLMVLCADEQSPAQLAEWLTESGFGRTRCHALEALGGPKERRYDFAAREGVPVSPGRLTILALEIVPDSRTFSLSLTSGLPDSCFEHDGQMTKREIRAVTLSSLAPRAGELLWDVGGGSGSVGIEWMLADPSCRTITLEPVPERAARIARNALHLGVPDLQVVEARAPQGFENLERPDAIFIGGGGSRTGVLEGAWETLKPGGRLVVNAVVMETEARLMQAVQEWGGTLTRLAVSRMEGVGQMHGFRPAMSVTQWVAWKSEDHS